MRSVLIRNRWAALLLLVPFLSVACDEGGGTGPEDADLSATAAEMESEVQEYLLGNKALLSIMALADAMIDACAGGGLLDVTSPWMAVDAFQSRIPAALLDRQDPQAISEACLGQSLVLDAGGEYVTGGSGNVPANGVRFALYDVNNQGQLITPHSAIGYVEIVDNSTEVLIAGSITAVVNSQTQIEFEGQLSGTPTSLVLDAEGYFSPDGSRQMEIALEAEYNVNAETVQVAASLETSELSATASFDGTASVEDEDLSGGFEARIDHGSTTIVMDGTLSSETGTVSGDIEVNGERVATFSVDAESGELNIVDASGGDLTQDDLNAIERMFGAAVSGFAVVLVLGLLLISLSGF